MISDIGFVTLLLALVASIYSVIAHIFGARNNHQTLIQSARNSLIAACGLLSIAVIALTYALVAHNFQIAYVAAYTNRDLSLIYRLSALWAGNDGSLLFWTWLLSAVATVVVLQKREMGKALIPYAASVIMLTQTFFLIVLLLLSNPFEKTAFIQTDGRGLNPLLENPGMILHPPTLLMGYVLFTIPFAFAIAALLTKRLGDEWIITIRRWTLLAWLFLGLGNVLGAWWAYVELGWGGYWAWDPVESASFMPWLTATAFLHSIMMQRRRGMLKIWNMVLIIITFALSIFGTFLTRSGILSSVHTFSESSLGPFFLVFIGIILFGSLGLLYYRSDDLKGEAEMESLVSRESTFLLNNLLLVGAAFAIFVGTTFPLISEAVRGVKITVGPPFFNQVTAPIFLAIIILTGVCALIGWRRATLKNLVRNFLWPLLTAILVGIILFIAGIRTGFAITAFFVCSFVLFTISYEWFRGTRARHRMRNENYAVAFWGLIAANRPRYGGYIVHIGILLMAIGIVGSSFYNTEQDATLVTGDSMNIGQYTLTYDDFDYFETRSKEVVSATLSVRKEDKLLYVLTPEKYFHQSYEQPVTEVAIHGNLAEDLYVILVGWDTQGLTTFKVLINPVVNWIWIGGFLLILGGLISFWPEKQRSAASKQIGSRR